MTPAGRPEVGTPINIRLGDELLAAIDAKAVRLGVSRAELIRTLLADRMTDAPGRPTIGNGANGYANAQGYSNAVLIACDIK